MASATTPRSELRGLVRRRLLRLGLAVAALAALLVIPTFASLYWMRILTNILLFATLAEALNIIAGYTGYPAFGNIVFFGIGAYATGVMMATHGAPLGIGLVASAVTSVLVALLVGPPLLRLRGHYFAIGTLALNEAVKNVVANWTSVTEGGKGLSLPIPGGSVQFTAAMFFYLFLGLLILTVGATFLVMRNRLGYGLRAIRGDHEVAASSGIDPTRSTTTAWATSALFTGLAGGIYAYWIGYIDPPSVFNMGLAVKIFVILLLGGAGTLFGPLLGAVFIELVATFTWSNTLQYHVGILGLIIILVVLFLPDGLAAFFRRRRTWLGEVVRGRAGSC